MYYRYYPYPYYNLRPYFYRYYNNQVAYSNQQLNNFGTMSDVIQSSNINQFMTPEPEIGDVVG